MLIRIAHHLEEGFIALLLALMTLITFSQVIARYLFGAGFGWALELTTYLFAWLVLFGVSYGIKVGAHIGIDVVVRQFPHTLRRTVGLLAVLCCCAYCIILLVGAFGYVHKLYVIGIEAQDLPIPRWTAFIMLPLGLALALLRLLQVAWYTLIGQQEGLRLADEAREAIEAVEGVETVEAVESFETLHPTAARKENAP
ncbi:TRAP transporter small permease [Candidatus Contendibacter odensensis]|uniref:TRAP transporter small permease protein n=1 Tax=Candidatus Contendobacter odensis Run_B_J11 TaxID=1400861 RepID=A0A7U7J340_9GAMM|nr:TRAP transporter small permease [Candidatus Contendobacter odensis]CDH43957.1 TRAP-like transport system, small permease component [Candidatus Contendobacter odensis Run_B_J11]